MYHVFSGGERTAVRDAITAFMEENMSPEATLVTFDAHEYQSGRLAEALGATSLFGGEQWFIIDTPSENPELKEELFSSLTELSDSPNTFVLLEGPLLAAERKKLEKHAASIEILSATKPERFNMFALTEALANRDKRSLWMLLQEARLEGVRDEEIIGILWWQLKTLRLAALADSPAAVGMKTFPFNKAKRALIGFPLDHVVERSQSLLQLYHDVRAGKGEMDTALEQWVLR